jgi:hypothetical protein
MYIQICLSLCKVKIQLEIVTKANNNKYPTCLPEPFPDASPPEQNLKLEKKTN